MLQHVIIKEQILESDLYDYLYSVEEVNKLVMQCIPFREAYKKLGREIVEGSYMPNKKLNHTHEGSIGNLCLEEIKENSKRCFKVVMPLH